MAQHVLAERFALLPIRLIMLQHSLDGHGASRAGTLWIANAESQHSFRS